MGCGASSQATDAQPPKASSAASAAPGPEASEHRGDTTTHSLVSGERRQAPQASRGKWTDLHEAAETCNVAEIQRQLQHCNPDAGDSKCWTPLLEASERGHLAAVQALLAGRSDPNMADNKGWTPLMAAAEFGHAAVAECLLQAGASPNWHDKQEWTCTMEAAEKRHAKLVRLFIQHKAELNARDKRGWTPFMAACEGGNIDCVRLLWIHGSEHNLESSYERGWTALDEAKHKGHKDIVEFMQPIVDAEKSLRKMIDTDDWQPEEALQYLEKAQQVWCLKDIVSKATVRLSEVLQRHIVDKEANDREQCFDWLLSHDSKIILEISDDNNAGTNNNADNNAVQPGLHEAITELCRGRLVRASSGQSVPEIKWAMASAVRTGSHKSLAPEMETVKSRYMELVDVPAGWDLEAMAQQLTSDGRMVHKQPISDPAVLAQMQALLDGTTRKRYTRDRRGDSVPDRLVIESMVSVQNDKNYEEYNRKCERLPSPGGQQGQLPQILTAAVHCPCLPALDSSKNEVWLFHGTSEAAAEAITAEDFRLNLAGTNAGTLYGSGIYFADSCSKSDEYCSPNSDDVRCLILCRVALGRVLYNDEVAPDAAALTRRCLAGEYDSILGDREHCRGTFKEFVVFDDDQAYPEYVLYYRRCYDLS